MTAGGQRRGRGHGDSGQQPEPRPADGWQVFSYLVGGMLLYGGIGWLVGRWTHISVLFPVGMLLGMGLAIAMILFRFAKP
jgi:ATP synthase protein I